MQSQGWCLSDPLASRSVRICPLVCSGNLSLLPPSIFLLIVLKVLKLEARVSKSTLVYLQPDGVGPLNSESQLVPHLYPLHRSAVNVSAYSTVVASIRDIAAWDRVAVYS